MAWPARPGLELHLEPSPGHERPGDAVHPPTRLDHDCCITGHDAWTCDPGRGRGLFHVGDAASEVALPIDGLGGHELSPAASKAAAVAWVAQRSIESR